ncbi:uncharacterized protein LOC128746332 [Sabethes cyaneus]|uniref:uncharacterized protein LOC128746332 n=1 Tax=Sabethes cyaneus TaxID=53552 RepID=UPI00237D786B|nr:uncharacterized protein LOC128746332 [Sabethes cyaneus]
MKFLWPIVLSVIGAVAYPQSHTVVITQVPPPPKVVPVNRTLVSSGSLMDSDLKRVATIGILFGAVQGEAQMEKKLNRQLTELSRAFNVSRSEVKARKVAAIERTMQRDQVAVRILSEALNLAMKPMTYEQYKREMSKLAEREKHSLGVRLLPMTVVRKTSDPLNGGGNQTTTDLDLATIKRQVTRHINQMRKSLAGKVKETVQFLERHDAALPTVGGSAMDQRIVKKLIGNNRLPDYSFYENVYRSDLENHIDALFRRRQDDGDGANGRDSKENGNVNEVTVTLGKEDDESESESDDDEPPGGLVGLIASLSGGEEGSDVGALVGALSAAITNIFGPDGLDVPGLLGTGTGLLAGLLGGDENFGKVLGGYVGIAVEGFSGGGADNNGAFFGNFLGAVIAALSSDPEDEDLPLRPELFIKNFFSGLQDAKRKGDPAAEGCGDSCKGSDLFGFIGHVVASIVGGVTSLVLNASLGSSGGSSQGSADASGASSAGSSGDGCKHPCDATSH